MDAIDFQFKKQRDSLVEAGISEKIHDSFSVDYTSLREKCEVNRAEDNEVYREPRHNARVRSEIVVFQRVRGSLIKSNVICTQFTFSR